MVLLLTEGPDEPKSSHGALRTTGQGRSVEANGLIDLRRPNAIEERPSEIVVDLKVIGITPLSRAEKVHRALEIISVHQSQRQQMDGRNRHGDSVGAARQLLKFRKCSRRLLLLGGANAVPDWIGIDEPGDRQKWPGVRISLRLPAHVGPIVQGHGYAD